MLLKNFGFIDMKHCLILLTSMVAFFLSGVIHLCMELAVIGNHNTVVSSLSFSWQQIISHVIVRYKVIFRVPLTFLIIKTIFFCVKLQFPYYYTKIQHRSYPPARMNLFLHQKHGRRFKHGPRKGIFWHI